ncbi:MAG: hypothetical protein CL483_09380 [Acidobacteria bacterium]|nr:hypothetical protein [Acidobacteriota bacterium]
MPGTVLLTAGAAYAHFLSPSGGPLPLDLKTRTVSLNFVARLFLTTRIASVQPRVGVRATLGFWR